MKKRIFYLDNLRIFLISLVIFHHTAIAYGASGGFYYIEVDEISVSAILLTIFAAVNQTYFMGLLFLISGYFTPPSYNRKGAGQFIKDRFLRLGVPLLIYALLIGPSLVYLLDYSQVMTYKSFFLQIILTLEEVNLGPLWYVEALIFFNLGYLIWRRFKANGTDKNRQKELPTNRYILIIALASGLLAFLIRLAYPVGEEFLALQLGYFTLYILLFIVGIMAYENNWLEKLTAKQIVLWFRTALAAIVAFPIAQLMAGALEGDHASGGLYIQAVIYAFWEPFVAFGISMFLLAWFRERFNKTSPVLNRLGESTYTVYIIHAPVLVVIMLSLRNLALFPMLKFLLVGSLGTVACFVLAHLILKIPYARRIL